MIDFRRSQFGATILCMCQHYRLWSGRSDITWMDDTWLPHTTLGLYPEDGWQSTTPCQLEYPPAMRETRETRKTCKTCKKPVFAALAAQNLQKTRKTCKNQFFAGFAGFAGFSVSRIIGGYSNWPGVAVCHPCFGYGPSVVYICHLGSRFVRVVCGVQVSSIQMIPGLRLNKR